MEKYTLDYINEKEYRRLEHGLKKYNMLAYKKLVFEIYLSLVEGNFLGKKINNESYEIELPGDKLFVEKYGVINFKYKVNESNKIVLLDSIEPKEGLLDKKRK